MIRTRKFICDKKPLPASHKYSSITDLVSRSERAVKRNKVAYNQASHRSLIELSKQRLEVLLLRCCELDGGKNEAAGLASNDSYQPTAKQPCPARRCEILEDNVLVSFTVHDSEMLRPPKAWTQSLTESSMPKQALPDPTVPHSTADTL